MLRIFTGFALVSSFGMADKPSDAVNSVRCEGQDGKPVFFDNMKCKKNRCSLDEVKVNDVLEKVESEVRRQLEISNDQVLLCTEGKMKTATIDGYTPQISNGILDVSMVTTKKKTMGRLIDKIMQVIDDYFKSNEGPLFISEDHYFLICEKLRERLKKIADEGHIHLVLEAMRQEDSRKNVIGLTWGNQLADYDLYKENAKDPVNFEIFRENQWKKSIDTFVNSINKQKRNLVIVLGESHVPNMQEFMQELLREKQGKGNLVGETLSTGTIMIAD